MKILIYVSKEKADYFRQLVSSNNAEFLYLEKKENFSVPSEIIPYFDLALISLSFDFDTSYALIQRLRDERSGSKVAAIAERNAADEIMNKLFEMDIDDYFILPDDSKRLIWAIEKLSAPKNILKHTADTQDDRLVIIGESEPVINMMKFIKKTAPSGLPVLIEGESGTGKELIANALHIQSARSAGPIIAINCGAMPHDLLENELFGHEKGAFTGAAGQKRGLFELADNGTLFIDEIGEMDSASQVKLLRVLETGSFRRLGSTQELHSDVRIIAATNKVLEDEIASGRFRTDLYYRLSVLRIAVPPLRNRITDIPLLINHFINQSGAEKNIEEETLQALMAYTWPGNIRELKNAVNSAVVMSEGQVIKLSDFPEAVRRKQPLPAQTSQDERLNEGGDIQNTGTLKNFIETAEKEFFIRALNRFGENKTEMAKALNISRDMLYRKLNKYGIEY
ncbi:MAG: sigma-54-dependent Fis family transcriptional regulator [Candidatus Goldbacteria bacterium]|nr:sigma-54-dependent Fis family transcriptional regulator [Candidatus Goldiibacteriota bacterium]